MASTKEMYQPAYEELISKIAQIHFLLKLSF